MGKVRGGVETGVTENLKRARERLAYLAYNLGEPDAPARPYVLGGLGATQYGSLNTARGT